MVEFHDLVVTRVEPDTAQSVIVSLRPEAAEHPLFASRAGQHLTLRGPAEIGAPLRSYSLCQAPGAGDLQIAIKRVPRGAFSEWAHRALHPGMVIAARRPSGGFGRDIARARRYLLIAGGSGIAPILSILEHLLAAKPTARMTLIVANRAPDAAQFRDRIARLKDRHCDRFGLAHLFSRAVPAGRLDAEGAARLLPLLAPPGTVDAAYLCGPCRMMDAVAAQLERQGLAPGRIRREFFVPPGGPQARTAPLPGPETAPESRLRLEMDGVEHRLALPGGGQSLLDAILAAGIDYPYSCKTGICGTCRCSVTEGKISQGDAPALSPQERARGEILPCRARAASARLGLRFDSQF